MIEINKIFWNILIVVGILLFLATTIIIITDFLEAKAFCSDEKGDYSFKFNELQHYCNEEPINRYTDGWEFAKFKPDLNNLKVFIPKN